ncbi:PaaI family thioesterase [Nocardioides limicola]|uniref:PaaI family thioesterase n=1 Tax=Nocardioides limicola TaxID=2803368 RepID=UPI00193AF320|nr:PaaI family thioesterase [Nocardioides sp. DJM-14]
MDAIQDRLFPTATCFGCGPASEKGLRLKSFPDGDRVVARFTSWPEHDNGIGYLNGGIIATVLDCHSGAAVQHTADDRGWHPLDGALLAFVTAGLDVRYRRPAPLATEVELIAELVDASEDAITVHTRMEFAGKVHAEAEAFWKRWRPR